MPSLRNLLDFLFPPRSDEAVLRNFPTNGFAELASPFIVPFTIPETTALLEIAHPAVRAALHEAKYHGNEKGFELLGAVLADYVLDLDTMDAVARISLVPIPLGHGRRKKRGFNQVEEVANRAAKTVGCAVESTLLIRVRETASQVSLPRRERERNMRGAFGAAHPADPSRTYVLIDDVTTTGATLQAAIDALSAAGAKTIIPLALAH